MSDKALKVKEIIAEKLGVNMEQLTDNARFIEDLAADSLTITELMMALEDEFKLEIVDEDAEKLKTVGDAVKYIESKVS
ncbi:MAG: acyl carrier protein [bacterium]|nr:acyl carrier protein [bacterium]